MWDTLSDSLLLSRHDPLAIGLGEPGIYDPTNADSLSSSSSSRGGASSPSRGGASSPSQGGASATSRGGASATSRGGASGASSPS